MSKRKSKSEPSSSSSSSSAGESKMVAVPSGVDIVWQLEAAAKNSWLSYLDEVQDALTSAAVSGRKAVNLVAGRTAMVADIYNLSQLSKGGEKRMRGLVDLMGLVVFL